MKIGCNLFQYLANRIDVAILALLVLSMHDFWSNVWVFLEILLFFLLLKTVEPTRAQCASLSKINEYNVESKQITTDIQQ